MEKAGASPPVHLSASGSSPPSLMSQSRVAFVEPAAPGKVMAGAVLGGWSRGTAEGKASGPGAAGDGAAASEGDGWEAKRSSGVAMGPKSVRAGTAVPGLSGRLGGTGSSWSSDSVEAEAGVGLGPARGPQGWSGEGLAPGGTSEAVAEEGTPGFMGRVSGAGVTVALGATGGKGVGASLAGGAGERSEL